MLLDENGKIFGKINILDVFAAVSLIAVISVIVYHYRTPYAQMTDSNDKIKFYVTIRDVRDFTLEYYQPGLLVTESKKGIVLGRIIDIEANEFMDNMTDITGKLAMTEKPKRLEITLEIEGEGFMTEQGYFIGKHELKVGEGINIKTKYIAVEGFVSDIPN